MTRTLGTQTQRSPSVLDRRRGPLVAVACGVLLALTTGTGAVGATPVMTFDLMLGETCLTGTARLNASVHLVVRNAGGRVLGRGTSTVDNGGYWTFCEFYGVIRPGFTIKATVFDQRGPIAVRTVSVPQLSLRLDRDTDLAEGKGPAGKSIVIQLSDYRFDPWNDSYGVEQRVQVGADGTYSYDFGADGIDIKGGANALIEWSNASNTVHVYRYAYAPYLSLQLHMPEIVGATRLNGPVTVTLRDNADNVIATGSAVGEWWSGAYWGLLADKDDEIYDLEPGTQLSATGLGSDVEWRVPAGVTSVSKLNDVVAGKCFPRSRYILSVIDRNWSEFAVFGTAAADGSFRKDFTSLTDIGSSFTVALECWTSSGDSVRDSFVVP